MADTYEVDKEHSKVVDAEAHTSDSDNESGTYVIEALVREDHGHDIKLRTMTWQRAAWLLCGDQVCLAIMAQSWSLSYVCFCYLHEHELTYSSVLGWVPGIITMIIAGSFFYITSITMHKFIMKHPQIKDICDFGYVSTSKIPTAYGHTDMMSSMPSGRARSHMSSLPLCFLPTTSCSSASTFLPALGS
jgi:hypothetical protein